MTTPTGSATTTASASASTYARRMQQRPLVTALLVLALVITPAWLVFVGFEAEYLTYHPQSIHGGLMLRRQPSHSTERSQATVLLELGEEMMTRQEAEPYPEQIYELDWSKQVPRREVLHLGALQRACTRHIESVIPWEYGRAQAKESWKDTLLDRNMDEQTLLKELRKCPPVDVFIPTGVRGEGYCEDAAAYTKYLHARMIPRWVMELELFDEKLNRKVTYHELCPRTPMLFLNHYWDGLRDDAKWPTTKPVYLMPNIEMFELEAHHYWQADVVLCKTALCAQYLTLWFEQEGNPGMTLVIYTRFTTSDLGTNALAAAGLESVDAEWNERRKSFDKPLFIHTAGGSWAKGTTAVLDCWLSRPDLPQLDFFMAEDLYKTLLKEPFEKRILASKNVNYRPGLDPQNFGLMLANTEFFLCTSSMEGYGHYINNARASGGIIVTTNAPPMNELLTPSSAVLVKATRGAIPKQFLGGASTNPYGLRNVEGFRARFSGDDVCAAVDELLKLSLTERKRRAHRARQQFFYDTAFFAMKMQQLRKMLSPREAA